MSQANSEAVESNKTSSGFRWSNVKSTTKFYMVFGVVMLLNASALCLYHFALRETSQSFTSLLDAEIAIREHALRADAAMKLCREEELEFVINRDPKWASELSETTENLISQIEGIDAVAKRIGDKESQERAAKVSDQVNKYSNAFSDLAKSFETKGLDHNSGLQGQFRSAVHGLEKELPRFDVGSLHSDLLKLLANEAKFAHLRDTQTRSALLDSIETYRQSLETSSIDSGAKEASLAALSRYESAIDIFLDDDASNDQWASSSDILGEAAIEMENAIASAKVDKAPYLLLMVRRAEKDYLMRGTQKYIDKTHKAVGNLRGAFAASDVSDQDKTLMNEKLDAYLASFDALVAENKHIIELQQTLTDTVHQAELTLGEIVDDSNAKVATQIASVSSKKTTLASMALVVTLVNILIASALITLVVRAFCNRVNAIAKVADQMSTGDLNARFNVDGTDELGALAECFNRFVVHVHQVIEELQSHASALANSGGELSRTAGELSEGADDTSKRAETVAAAAEQMSVSIGSMGQTGEEITQNIRTVAESAQELGSSIAEISSNADKASGVAGRAASLATESNDRIAALDSAAVEIGKVVEVIQDIAEQTNLLALNATIEAARAGDAGKGFAVVASEVKELSRQTTDATEGIRKRVEGIQMSSTEAIDSIRTVSEVIAEADDLSRAIAAAVEQQNATTREVARSAEQTSMAMSTMSRGISETVVAGQEIAKNIAGVHSVTQGTVSGANQARNASSDMEDLARSLHGVVSQFKL